MMGMFEILAEVLGSGVFVSQNSWNCTSKVRGFCSMYIFNSIKKHVGGQFKDSNKCAPAVSAADKGGGGCAW